MQATDWAAAPSKPMDGTMEARVKALEVHQHYLRQDLDSLTSEVTEFRSAAWKLAIGAILTLGRPQPVARRRHRASPRRPDRTLNRIGDVSLYAGAAIMAFGVICLLWELV
jgi:hypothetical protein